MDSTILIAIIVGVIIVYSLYKFFLSLNKDKQELNESSLIEDLSNSKIDDAKRDEITEVRGCFADNNCVEAIEKIDARWKEKGIKYSDELFIIRSQCNLILDNLNEALHDASKAMEIWNYDTLFTYQCLILKVIILKKMGRDLERQKAMKEIAEYDKLQDIEDYEFIARFLFYSFDENDWVVDIIDKGLDNYGRNCSADILLLRSKANLNLKKFNKALVDVNDGMILCEPGKYYNDFIKDCLFIRSQIYDGLGMYKEGATDWSEYQRN